MANLKNLKPFKKGNDPRRNTKGRPTGAGEIRLTANDWLERAAEKAGLDIEDIELEMLMRLMNEARNGKLWAFKLFTEFRFGKPGYMCPGCKKIRGRSYRQNIVRDTEEEARSIQKAHEFMERWTKK